MMNQVIQMLANKLIQDNPQIANSPRAREAIQAIQSGDSKRGIEIADNLCQSYGVSREEGIKQAMNFFRL